MKKNIVWLILCVIFIFKCSMLAYGSNDLLEGELEYDKIQKNIDETCVRNFDFEKEVGKVVTSGKIDYRNYFKRVIDTIKKQIVSKKNVILKIIIIVIVTAIFTNFANTMENAYVSQTSFMIVYMSLVTLVVKVYMEVSNIGVDIIHKISNFIKVLIPTYTVATFASVGMNTAMAVNQITMFVILIIEHVFLKLVLPLINIYLLMNIVNNMYEINIISKMVDLIKILIKFVMKIALIFITGMSTIERLVNSSDIAKVNMLNNGIGIIPYIGNSIKNMNETVMSSAAVIKGALGGVSLIVIVIMCLVPIINIIIYIFVYESLAICSEPISDARVVNCIKSIADSSKLVLEVVVTSMALFVIAVAIVSS